MIEDTLKFARYALAVSGGKDSMVLLDMFIKLKSKRDFFVINIEHGIRGDESVADSKFVTDYCAACGVACRCERVDAVAYSKERGYTVEQGARLLRREIFARLVAEGTCDRVATAHHTDDQTESILMHILRGSGINGLKGMPRDDGVVVRPLLDATRADIDAYAEKHCVPYVEDATNGDTAYYRNYMRREILPVIAARYPSYRESIDRLRESACEYEEFVLSQTEAGRITESGGAVSVEIGALAPPIIAKKYFAECLARLGVTADIERRHYELMLALIDAGNGAGVDLPYGVRAVREYDKMTFFRAEEGKDVTEIPFGVGVFRVGSYEVTVTEGRREGALNVDADKMKGAVLRTRREGDAFKRCNGGRKKLKDFLIDRKIPSRLRDGVALAAAGSEILAICGVELSDTVKITEETVRVLSVTAKEIV